MKEFFEWIASLPEEQSWGLFVGICALMALMPYWSRLRKRMAILFRSEKPKIIDFSWRHAPDHQIIEYKGKEYFMHANGKQFILEGGIIQLNWNVRGAYQIDVHPIGESLKGNGIKIKAAKAHTTFTLTAHTWKGKLTKTLTIDPQLFRTIQTVEWTEVMSQNKTLAVVCTNTLQPNSNFQRINPTLFLKKLRGTTNLLLQAKNKRLTPESPSQTHSTSVLNNLSRKRKTLHVRFSPQRYNAALLNENNKLNTK